MSPPTPVRGLFEAHLTVSDLGRSTAFYRDLLGLQVALEVPDRDAAFFWCGEPGRAMLGLWSLGSMPMGMSLHLAFQVELEDLLAAPERLEAVDDDPGEQPRQQLEDGLLTGTSVHPLLKLQQRLDHEDAPCIRCRRTVSARYRASLAARYVVPSRAATPRTSTVS